MCAQGVSSSSGNKRYNGEGPFEQWGYLESAESAEDFEGQLPSEFREAARRERKQRELQSVLGHIGVSSQSSHLSVEFLSAVLSDLEGVFADLCTEVAVFEGRQAAAARYLIRRTAKYAKGG